MIVILSSIFTYTPTARNHTTNKTRKQFGKVPLGPVSHHGKHKDPTHSEQLCERV